MYSIRRNGNAIGLSSTEQQTWVQPANGRLVRILTLASGRIALWDDLEFRFGGGVLLCALFSPSSKFSCDCELERSHAEAHPLAGQSQRQVSATGAALLPWPLGWSGQNLSTNRRASLAVLHP